MHKALNITKNNKTYTLKLTKANINNMDGIKVELRQANTQKCLMFHFLDFSNHKYKTDVDIKKFMDEFKEEHALKWVEGYVKGKR